MATAAEESGLLKVEKLTAENYNTWKFNMKMYLIGKGLWDIVKGTETLSETASAKETRKFKKRENLALASVCLSVSTGLQIYVRSAESGKEAWEPSRNTLKINLFPEKFSIEENCILQEWERN